MMDRTGRWGLMTCSLLTLAMAPASLAAVSTPIFIALPGQRPKVDELCVATSAAVGQSEENVNSDRLILRSLSGTSPLCRDAGAPILAQADLVESDRFRSTLSITVPTGFSALPLTTKDRFDGKRFKGTDGVTEYAVYSFARAAVPELDRYLETNRARQMQWLHASLTPVENLTIDGVPARRWETTTRSDALGGEVQDPHFNGGLRRDGSGVYRRSRHELQVAVFPCAAKRDCRVHTRCVRIGTRCREVAAGRTVATGPGPGAEIGHA